MKNRFLRITVKIIVSFILFFSMMMIGMFIMKTQDRYTIPPLWIFLAFCLPYLFCFSKWANKFFWKRSLQDESLKTKKDIIRNTSAPKINLSKASLFKKINISSDEFEEKFWKSKSAESFYNSLPSNIDDPMANVFKGSMQVVMKTRSKSNLSEKLQNVLEVNVEKQMNVIDKNYTFL